MAKRICLCEQLGKWLHTNAAAPAANGVAMDVPEYVA
jgi:hypothetical protein